MNDQIKIKLGDAEGIGKHEISYWICLGKVTDFCYFQINISSFSFEKIKNIKVSEKFDGNWYRSNNHYNDGIVKHMGAVNVE